MDELSEVATEVLSREAVGFLPLFFETEQVASPMVMRSQGVVLSPMLMREPLGNSDGIDIVARALRLSAMCDLSSPLLEAGRNCVQSVEKIDWRVARQSLPMIVLLSVCASVDFYTADTVGANTGYFYEIEVDRGTAGVSSSSAEFVNLTFLGCLHRISQSRPFDYRFQGTLGGESRSFRMRLPAPVAVLKPTVAMIQDYLGLQTLEKRGQESGLSCVAGQDSGVTNEGNSLFAPVSYLFSNSPPVRVKRDDSFQQDPAGVWYEMQSKVDARLRCDKLMWVRRMGDIDKSRALFGRDMSFDAESIWFAVRRECVEPCRLSAGGKKVTFENAASWTYLEHLAAFSSAEMREKALRMEFSRNYPVSGLSILHFQHAADFGAVERSDCTILHRLVLSSCLEMLERTLVTFYSAAYTGCTSNVRLLLSGMALSHSVSSNGFVTFVLDEALSIFADDVANRRTEEFRSRSVFGSIEQSAKPSDFATLLTDILENLIFSDNAEKRYLKEVGHGRIVYTAVKRKLIIEEKVDKVAPKAARVKIERATVKPVQGQANQRNKPVADVSGQCCVFFLGEQLGLKYSCKKGKECKRMHFSKGQCSIEAAHAACDRIWEPMGTEIRAEIANQPSFFRK